MRLLSPAQWGVLQADFEPVRFAGRLLQEVIVDMKEPDPSLNVSLPSPFRERRAEITLYIYISAGLCRFDYEIFFFFFFFKENEFDPSVERNVLTVLIHPFHILRGGKASPQVSSDI